MKPPTSGSVEMFSRKRLRLHMGGPPEIRSCPGFRLQPQACRGARTLRLAGAPRRPELVSFSVAMQSISTSEFRESRRRSDGGADRRVGTEPAPEHRVHPVVILQVVEVDVHLEDLVHRRSGLFQFRLDLVEHRLGMHGDVAGLVVALSGDEHKVAVGDPSREQRRLRPAGWLSLDVFFTGAVSGVRACALVPNRPPTAAARVAKNEVTTDRRDAVSVTAIGRASGWQVIESVRIAARGEKGAEGATASR